VVDNFEKRLAKLEADTRLLLDIEAIRVLRMRYHECNNERRSHEIPDLFTDDASFDFGFMGKAASVEFFRGSSTRTAFIKQMIHNHVVEVDGDRARGACYQDARAVFHGRAFIISGRYDDEYRRTPKGWKFSRMVFDPFLMMPADSSWARPEDRQVDPHKGFLARDAAGNPVAG
jgi:hypothetical protein